MLLDLEDNRLRVQTRLLSDGRRRLVIDYPPDPPYREAVFAALAELLRPASRDGRRAAPEEKEAA